MPLVCVIMPAYRAVPTLRMAALSVMRQTWKDWELVIVNDASGDGTGELAERLAAEEGRIRVLHQPRNLGAAAAMNRAWRGSSSPLVAVLDADDAAFPSRLSQQVEHLARNAEVSVLGSAAHFVDLSGVFLRTVTLPRDHKTLARRRWAASPFIHPTVMMRRGFLDGIGGYQDGLRLGEDYDLWMRGFLHGGFVYENLAEPLVIYRTRAVQRWEMIKASARVRLRAGRREGRAGRALLAAARVLTEGALEQTGVFAWRHSRRSQGGKPPDLSAMESE